MGHSSLNKLAEGTITKFTSSISDITIILIDSVHRQSALVTHSGSNRPLNFHFHFDNCQQSRQNKKNHVCGLVGRTRQEGSKAKPVTVTIFLGWKPDPQSIRGRILVTSIIAYGGTR